MDSEEEKRKKRLTWQLPIFAMLIVGTILIVGGQTPKPYIKKSGTIFGTIYNITYQSDNDLGLLIEKELAKVDSSLSMFNPNSTISKINRNDDVDADELLLYVFKLAQEVSRETKGAFDITVAPLVNIWGFGFIAGEQPNEERIDSLMQLVGYDKVRLVGQRIIKDDPRIMIDLSAVAKGYGSDRIASLLSSKGVENFMIEIGGEIVTRGVNPKNAPWKIGVTKPSDDSLSNNQELQTILDVSGKSIATSGNYRNFYYKDGKKYAHTIDPLTGYPVQHNILSATIIADNCTTADAYATAFMVLGLDDAKEILSKHPELKAYLICCSEDGNLYIWTSDETS